MITDDELLLYYYRDGLDAADRARIGAALSAQPELAQRLHKLISRLDAAAAIPDVPVLPATQERWKAALDRAARKQISARTIATKKWFGPSQWLAAAAVVLIALVVVPQIISRPPPLPEVASGSTPAPAASDAETSAYERGLKSHLATTEQQLASLERATPEDRAQLVDTIIEQNRIYALAAERAGEPQLARVLRAFSPVLESLKQEGADPTGSVAQLAFEMRVMQGRLGAAPASTPRSTTL